MLFIKDQSIKYIGITEAYDEQKRDIVVKDILDKNSVFNESFDDQVLFSPGTIKTMEGRPYSVFTIRFGKMD